MNGGARQSQGYINLRVGPDCIVGAVSPHQLFADYAQKTGRSSDICESYLGMMTAASMRSCAIASVELLNEKILVMATSGLGNLRRAGDKAEYRQLYSAINQVGTINLLVATSASLSPAAQAEALIIATEAKVAFLQQLGVVSAVSQLPATGTGTDSLAIVSPISTDKKQAVEFVGKHTVIGECLARAVMGALAESIGESECISHE